MKLANASRCNVAAHSEGESRYEALIKRGGTLPLTYEEVCSSRDAAEWQKAMQMEVDALEGLQVWDLVDRPANVKIVRSKWVFARKLNADGSLNKLKARLVAVGSSQRPGIDYDYSFSPTVKAESVYLLFAVAAARRYRVRVIDVSSHM